MPERTNVLVVVEEGVPIRVFGGVKDMCNNMEGFSYYYLREKKKYPYSYKKYEIHKIKFR